MLLVWCLLMLSALPGLHGRNLEVNWTLTGVEAYRDRSSPLRTELGDVLILRCERVSNLFIQAQDIQHDYCNASAGLGKYDYNGFCINGTTLMLTLTENSQSLTNTINFENNRLYYFASYSNNQLGDADDSSINSGGQCADGLKMVVLIGEDPTTPIPPGIPPGTEGNKAGDSNDIPIRIIAGAGGGALFIILIVLLICICICCYCKRNRAKVDLEKDESIEKNMEKHIKNDAIVNQCEDHKGLKAETKVDNDFKTRDTTVFILQSQSNSKAVKTSSTTQASSTVHENRTGIVSTPSQVNKSGRGGKDPAVNGKKTKAVPTNNEKSTNKQGDNNRNTAVSKIQTQFGPSKTVRNGTTTQNKTGPASSPPQGNKNGRGGKDPTVSGKKKEDVPTKSEKSIKQGQVLIGGTKAGTTCTAKTNNRTTVTVVSKTHIQIGPSKTMRNGTNITTQNKTGPASSPSQANQMSKGDKAVVHNGRTHHKGVSIVQSSTGSSAAAPKQSKPSSTAQASVRNHRPAPPPPPTQSLPPSSGGAKRERVNENASLPPLVNKTHNTNRTQNTEAVLFKTNSSTVHLQGV